MELSLNIFQRILGVMRELSYVQKGSKLVNGLYSYASHDQVTAALHPYFTQFGIVAVPTVEECMQEGNRTKVRIAVTFINTDTPTDNFTVHSVGYGVDPGDKGPGKAFSYAFKYALLKTFMLETGDDPDKDANAVYEPAKCLEFELLVPSDMTEKDRKKMNKFLASSAEAMGKNVEEMKMEAAKRMPEFLKALENWKEK
jgi:hypothetical protein